MIPILLYGRLLVGRMGGSSFSSSSSSSSSSSRSSSVTTVDLYIMFITGTTMGTVVWLLTDHDTKNTVLKLQVGLSGLRSSCSLKKDLNRIAEIADTSTSEGLQYVLTETIIALLNYHDHRIFAHSSVDVCCKYGGEIRFKKLSIEEREKFDEETFVNLNNIKKKKKKKTSTKLRTSSVGISNEYIVVTILVCAKGGQKHKYMYNDLPPCCINNIKDLKEALLKLATIHHSREILAVEVLWTPQEEEDTLSEEEFLEDYPLLKPVL